MCQGELGTSLQKNLRRVCSSRSLLVQDCEQVIDFLNNNPTEHIGVLVRSIGPMFSCATGEVLVFQNGLGCLGVGLIVLPKQYLDVISMGFEGATRFQDHGIWRIARVTLV